MTSPLTWFTVAGIFAGLSLYTYMASRVVPIFFLLFLTYLALFHRPALKLRWHGLLLFVFTYLIIVAPLVIYLLSHPGAESRISEVDAPLLALAGGELKPVLENSLKVIAMFGLRGDPLWRQNVAHLPVFDPLISLFFYIGLAISLWRWREPRHLFLILWLLTATIPSIVTIDAPSSIRIINALPVIAIFPVIGLEVIHFSRWLSTVSLKLSPEISKRIAFLLIALVLLFNTVRTTRAIFHTWPGESEVQFVWQTALTEAAAFLDASADGGPVAVGGWTPETMDAPTMELHLGREDLSLRYFDPTQALIIPAPENNSASAMASRLVHPTALPIQASLANMLLEWAGKPKAVNSFTYYEINQPILLHPDFPAEVTFGGELTFLGFDFEEQPHTGDNEPGAAPLALITYWRVDEPTAESRRIFLHLVDDEGNILTQDDGLGAPAAHWLKDDIIIQRLVLSDFEDNNDVRLRLGVYNPLSGQRLLTEAGADFEEVDKK